MAISAVHYEALKELHRRGELPQGGRILEIGEANWYGDFSPEIIEADIAAVADSERRESLRKSFKLAWESPNTPFAIAKVIYAFLLQPRLIMAIDLNGTATAIKTDLNRPLPFSNDAKSKFETVFNHGTAEHIFNIANVFRIMHDYCAVGGLMLHESPFTGWIDHGFYTLQPTLYFDVAAANYYDLVYMAITQIESKTVLPIEFREQLLEIATDGQLPDNAQLFIAMRKTVAAPFAIPMQACYAGNLTDEARTAWRTLR